MMTGGWQLKYVLFSSLFVEDSNFDEHIFQLACNHHLEDDFGCAQEITKSAGDSWQWYENARMVQEKSQPNCRVNAPETRQC